MLALNPGGKSVLETSILQPDLGLMNSQLSSHLQAVTCILATGTCK